MRTSVVRLEEASKALHPALDPHAVLARGSRSLTRRPLVVPGDAGN
jgi:hypothetical protein